jgi:hypothetical protein
MNKDSKERLTHLTGQRQIPPFPPLEKGGESATFPPFSKGGRGGIFAAKAAYELGDVAPSNVNRFGRLPKPLVLFCLLALCTSLFLAAGHALALEEGYKQYKDPRQRFTFDYPGTMQVTTTSPDEVKISHPKATLRIRLVVEERPKKPVPTAPALLETMKKNLKNELKGASILEEGTLPGLKGAQGYVICFFKDRRNMDLVQLLQYYVTEDRLLQMIISDRPEGFKNLQKVIRHIHQSLRISKADLK